MALPPLILPATGSAGTIACVTVSTQLVARISVFSAKRTQMMENKFRICNDLRNDEVREITKRTQMKGSSLFSVGARDSWPSRSDPVTVAVGFSPRNAWICWPPTFTTVHVASVVGHGFCRPRSRARKSVAGVSTKRTQMKNCKSRHCNQLQNTAMCDSTKRTQMCQNDSGSLRPDPTTFVPLRLETPPSSRTEPDTVRKPAIMWDGHDRDARAFPSP